MGRKPSKSAISAPPKPRKRSATAGRKAKPWRDRNRLDLLPLEPAVAKMVIQRTPDEFICAWVRGQGTFFTRVEGEDGEAGTEVSRGPWADVTDEQVLGLIRAIRERWKAVQDDPANVAQERADHGAMLAAAIHDAWNKPIMAYDKDAGGWVPLKNPDGTVAVQADHKALAAYMKERREFYGFSAPQKHLHLHGEVPPPKALSPAEREAEVRALLDRRAAALAAGQLPAGVVIDVPVEPDKPARIVRPKKSRKGVDG